MDTLDFSVNFLTGMFHGEDWPPSPAKFYQALVAGARYRYRRGTEWKSDFDRAFRWLEEQPPPTIVAPPAIKGQPYFFFGPDNDRDIEVRDWIRVSSKGVTDEPIDSNNPLRSRVSRQPWYVHGTVHYLYSGNGAPVEVLTTISESLVALGHGIDLASGRLVRLKDEQIRKLSGERWSPLPSDSNATTKLFVPRKGWYDRLESNYLKWSSAPRGSEVDVRKGTVPPFAHSTAYVSNLAPPARPYLAYSLRTPDGERPFSVSWESGMEIAAQLRHAASENFRSDGADEDFVRVYVMGHGVGIDRDRRLSYVPLPSIGHNYVDGRVRRALVTGPRGDGQIKEKDYLLDGALLSSEGKPTARLASLTGIDSVLERYIRPSRSWISVTPVILHGHDSKRGRVNPEKTRVLLQEAFDQAGIGSVLESYAYRAAPWWPGTGASQQLRVPSHLAMWPRYHVRIRLKVDVSGPLLVGIGRHYGIGVFAAAT